MNYSFMTCQGAILIKMGGKGAEVLELELSMSSFFGSLHLAPITSSRP